MPDTRELFDKISKYYDFLNTLFSAGIDARWRKQLVAGIDSGSTVIDVATGTAEVISEGFKKNLIGVAIGIDPSRKMLKIGKEKLDKIHADKKYLLVDAVAETIPFKDNMFDAATIAFGIRNTIDYKKSLTEISRVLKPGGKIGILEFGIPSLPVLKQLYLMYFKFIMPFVGSLFGNRKEYKYLSESTINFPQKNSFTEVINECGFSGCMYQELTFGIAILYTANKP